MADDPLTTGREAPEPVGREVEPHRELIDQKDSKGTLTSLKEKALARMIRKRWDRLETVQRMRLAELKVNYLRYRGHSFIQVHPSDPNRVFIPPGASSKRAPTINKIRRAVHRYMAQVTADEPVMEGQPTDHTDEARDQAEASTKMLRGEWSRMELTHALQRAVHFAGIFRSAFWFFKWDPRDGTEEPAMKFFDNERGERVLLPVDENGNEVSDVSKAAKIKPGNMRVEVMTPANVRWSNGRYAHKADEVIVGETMILRDIYDAFPDSKKIKLVEILGSHEPPINAQEWLEDMRAETPRGMKRDYSEAHLSRTGDELPEDDNVLDERLLIIHYFKKPNRTYKKGFYGISVGDYMLHKGVMRYKGLHQVIQFKLIDEVGDPLGLGLVDLLKDPQELLDFVNGQILRYLQMMKRRWFVPLHSGVKSRDLLSPTRSIIEFNAAAGQPIPEVQPEIPNSMVEFVGRFDEAFDDEMGIHDTLQGKHVPGVSSGRHAEALRSGDETLLGLTRTQLKLSLEAASEVMLAIAQREWKTERRVRYLGEDREYLELAFKGADFGGTSKCVLLNSTLLMLTPAQRLDTIMSLGEAGALMPDEIRRLAPLGDVMGISLSEDVHYQRARRQNNRFLAGPPKKLLKIREEYEAKLEAIMPQENIINQAAPTMEPGILEMAVKRLEDAKAEAELLWTEAFDEYAWDHRSWEDRKDIARIHAQAHADALAHSKVDRMPEWWVEAFEDHATLEYELGFPELVMEAAQVQSMAGPPAPEDGGEFDAGPVETTPAGFEFNNQTPDVVTGGATGAP